MYLPTSRLKSKGLLNEYVFCCFYIKYMKLAKQLQNAVIVWPAHWFISGLLSLKTGKRGWKSRVPERRFWVLPAPSWMRLAKVWAVLLRRPSFTSGAYRCHETRRESGKRKGATVDLLEIQHPSNVHRHLHDELHFSVRPSSRGVSQEALL